MQYVIIIDKLLPYDVVITDSVHSLLQVVVPIRELVSMRPVVSGTGKLSATIYDVSVVPLSSLVVVAEHV